MPENPAPEGRTGLARRFSAGISEETEQVPEGRRSNRKLHRVAADSCDDEVAEKKARELMNGFEAAAKGEPTPIPAGALTTLLDDAVKTFLDTKAGKPSSRGCSARRSDCCGTQPHALS